MISSEVLPCSLNEFPELLQTRIKKIIKSSQFNEELIVKVEEITIRFIIELYKTSSPFPIHRGTKPASYKLHVISSSEEVKKIVNEALNTDDEEMCQIIIEKKQLEKKIGSVEISGVIENRYRVFVKFHDSIKSIYEPEPEVKEDVISKLKGKVTKAAFHQDTSQCDSETVKYTWGGPIQIVSHHPVSEKSSCTII